MPFDIAPDLDVITQGYMCTSFPEFVTWRCPGSYDHYGIDLAAAGCCGKPQYATRAGTIYAAGNAVMPGQPGLGITVILSTDEGYDVIYGHFGGFNVGPGQRVKPGDVVGFTGTTGYSTGCHAHIEVREAGNLNAGVAGVVDPAPWLWFAEPQVQYRVRDEEANYVWRSS